MANTVLPIDTLAYQHPWRRIKTGIKGFVVLILLMLSHALTKSPLTLWTAICLILGIVCAHEVGRLGFRTFLTCLIALLVFLGLSVLVLPLSLSVVPLAPGHGTGIALTWHWEVLDQAFTWLQRGVGGGSLLLAYALCTPMADTIKLLARLKVPQLFLELMSVGYRFLGVTLSEAAALTQAQQLRLGHRAWRLRLMATAGVTGILFSRVTVKAQRYQLARQLRLEDIDDDAAQ